MAFWYNKYVVWPRDFLLPLIFAFAWYLAYKIMSEVILPKLAKSWVPTPRRKSEKVELKPTKPSSPEKVRKRITVDTKPSVNVEYEPAPPPSPTRGRRFSVEDEDDVTVDKDSEGHTRRLRRVSSAMELHDKNKTKFVASAWKGMAYTFNGLVGIWVLQHQPWIWDPRQWFEGWNKEPHEFPDDLKFYYNLIWGFYIFSTFHLPFEPRQKDFTEMMVHHIVTNLLIFASYLTGMIRIGCFVMVLHDMADPWMEAAKIFLYAGNQGLANFLFAMFAIVFAVSRLYYYPKYVLMGTLKNGPGVLSRGSLTGFMILLATLQGLHIFWFALILKIIIDSLRSGNVEGDVRDED